MPKLIITVQIIIVDYFFVKRGNIHTPSLFNPDKGSLYYYSKGWNLKALGSWVCAAVFGIPGLVGAYHPTWVGIAATHIYQTGWVICFVVAAAFYYASSFFLKAQIVPSGREAPALGFETLAETEGYLDGDDPVEFASLGVHVGEEDVEYGSGSTTSKEARPEIKASM